MQFSNTNCMSSDLHSSLLWSWFECNVQIPTAWALICTAADLNGFVVFWIPTAWALIKTLKECYCFSKNQLLELWFAQQLTLKLIWMQCSNTNCRSSDLHSSWFECNFRSWFECNFRIPTAWALIKTLKAIFEYHADVLVNVDDDPDGASHGRR
jgi:hypothetical protein